ncbi:IS630 family transposase [Actinoallomurus bryophytorum]
MAEPVRARRLSDQEGQRLTQIVRRGKHESIRVRRAMMIMASASGTPVPAIARLVAADEDTVREVIHAFNESGLAALDPKWAGGRPRLISDDDVEFIATTATTRPAKPGRSFTHWSIRKLAAYLADNPIRTIDVGRERLRQILHSRRISFQRTRTWKSTSSDRSRSVPATDRRGHRRHGRTGCPPPTAAPTASATSTAVTPWAMTKAWGVTRRHKGGDHSLAALKSIQAARPDGAKIYVIMDNLSANKTPAIRTWAKKNKVELCLTPTYASWANPIEAQFGSADLHDGQLRPPQPHRPGPPATRLPALAQHQRPPPRHPGRTTPRTRPHPQRTRATLGPPPPQSRMITPGERMWTPH